MTMEAHEPERQLRVAEVAVMTGYKESTIRKKLLLRQISYRKVGRIITIPESEVHRLLQDFRPRIEPAAVDVFAAYRLAERAMEEADQAVRDKINGGGTNGTT